MCEFKLANGVVLKAMPTTEPDHYLVSPIIHLDPALLLPDEGGVDVQKLVELMLETLKPKGKVRIQNRNKQS